MQSQRSRIALVLFTAISFLVGNSQLCCGDTVARDPSILPPPITRTEPTTVSVTMTIEEKIAELADGTTYPFWTFDGTVPGQMLRVMEGDTVEFTLQNPITSTRTHNIDLHAVNGPGGGAPDTIVAPGEEIMFTFEATHAGSFIYHCAFGPKPWEHIAQGMYGGIVVEPVGGLPPVDREFYVIQGEWYTTGAFGEEGLQAFDLSKAMSEDPEYFTLNGHKDALTEIYPLEAQVGETIRIFYGVGGPNVGASFHVIGEIFDKVYTGSPETYVANEETWYVPPGSMATFELTLDQPGDNLLVDHALFRVAKGAAGVLHVTSPDLTGDFHGDGDVDGNDFLMWQRGESPLPLSQSDLDDWKANYGATAGPIASAATVPEPATAIMLVLGMAALLFRRQVVAV